MKGYGNFMSKKGFHPGSYANQKRVQEAEAKAAAKQKYDEETLAQYQKEQELFQQRSLVSKESKEKLSLSFMYDQPPGPSQKNDSKTKEDDSYTTKFEPKREPKFKPGDVYGDRKRLKSTSSDDEEPEIKLEWKREEPKAKKPTIKQQDIKRIKKEK